MPKSSIPFLVVLLAAAGCADNGDPVGGAGVGGGAGIAGGAGGIAGGAAGMAAGAGGMAGGTAGTAGMAGGAGGMAGSAGGMAGGAAPGSPKFSAIFDEIIVGTGCNGGALCHGGTVGNLTMNDKMATYTALVGVSAMGMNLNQMPPHCADSGMMRVVAGNPDMSLLMKKIEGTQTCGTAMPPNPPLLTAAQQMQIRMWIANGAMND
jgi:hypothetical protein